MLRVDEVLGAAVDLEGVVVCEERSDGSRGERSHLHGLMFKLWAAHTTLDSAKLSFSSVRLLRAKLTTVRDACESSGQRSMSHKTRPTY